VSTPRECPRCGESNTLRTADGPPRDRGLVTFRRRTCRQCGYTGSTAEFWVEGEYLAEVAEALASGESDRLRTA